MDTLLVNAQATTARRQLVLGEFIPLMALLTALDAMSIDAMLPALSHIARDLSVTNTAAQHMVGTMFVGMTIGQLIGGPLSDNIGRKPAIYWGLALYIIGCVLAIFATAFSVLLAARVLQGFGASIPVVVSTAMVRDLYQGAPMARIMSFIGAVFILVPVLAPLAGQGILLVAHWRWIFVMFVLLSIPATVWFYVRQPETLPLAARAPFSIAQLAATVLEVCRNRVAMGYSVAAGILFGAFLGYLSSAQQIFQETFHTGNAFVLYFSALSATIGLALFSNGKLVMRFGMQRLTRLGYCGIAVLALLFLPVALAFGGRPPVWLFMAYLAPTLFCVGLLFGNLNALAMEPLGHVAGVGASVSGTLTLLAGLPLGMLIGQAFDGTVVPVVVGFAVLAPMALAVMWWAEQGRRTEIAVALGESVRHR